MSTKAYFMSEEIIILYGIKNIGAIALYYGFRFLDDLKLFIYFIIE